MTIRRVFVLILRPSDQEVIIDDLSVNPGIGGTEFVALNMGCELSRVTKVDVTFLTDFPLTIKVNTKARVADIKEHVFSADNIYVSALQYLDLGYVLDHLRLLSNVKVWTHHPFPKIVIDRPNWTYITIGSYQNATVSVKQGKKTNIQNIFRLLPASLPQGDRKLPTASAPLNIIYIGALVPGKSFHLLAREWGKICKKFPNAKLHVIGSIATHGIDDETHSEIPATKAYARRIISNFKRGRSDWRKSVFFYGNLGPEKFQVMREAHVAILNPTGKTEAFPASPLECFSFGLPVISSGRYGMADSMHFFSDLSLRNSRDIVQKLEHLLSSDQVYRDYSIRSRAVANFYALQLETIMARWVSTLFEESAPTFEPVLNVTSRRQLWVDMASDFFKTIIKKFL